MSSEWGKGAANNQIGWGQAAGNSTNGWGESHKTSYAGLTDLVGLTTLNILYGSANYCSSAANPTPTVSNNAGAGVFSSTSGLVFVDTATGEINIASSTAGNYVITYTDTDAATATFSLSLNAAPSVTVSVSSGSICIGASTTLTASGANSYVWNDGQTTNPITVSPTTTTNFTATGTDSNGCTGAGTTQITVYPLPSVSISGALTYCAGGSTTLDAGSFVSYLWSNGETTQTISATAGNYTVTVTDSNGCSNTSAQVAVSELALPTVAITGTLSYCVGNSTTLTATAGLSSYLWSSGETTQAITVTSAGGYSVTGTDSNGCSNTSATSTVTELPLDNAAFSYSASSFEPTDADPTPTITGLTGGTFSGTTGLVINSTTGEIDLSASTEASHTVTYNTSTSGSSVCPNTSTFGVTIAVAGIANNYSMAFDGSLDYLTTSNNTIGNISNNAYTFSAWINITANSNIQTILSNINSSGWKWEINSGLSGFNNITFYIDSAHYIRVNNFSNYGSWVHLVAIINGASNNYIYINKVNQTLSNNFSTPFNIPDSTEPLIIGAQDNGAGGYTRSLNGNMDELAIWNTELTASQIAQIYNATSTGKTANLSTISGSNLKYWNRMGD